MGVAFLVTKARSGFAVDETEPGCCAVTEFVQDVEAPPHVGVEADRAVGGGPETVAVVPAASDVVGEVLDDDGVGEHCEVSPGR